MHTSVYESSARQFSLPPASFTSTQHSATALLSGDSPNLCDKKVMVGLSFGRGGVPIDILCLLLAAAPAKTLTVLVTDSFATMNGVAKEPLEQQRMALEESLATITSLYKLPITVVRCSSFMDSDRYRQVFTDVTSAIEARGFGAQIVQLVPERFRHIQEALLYPLHEMAVTLFMSRFYDTQIKLGPSTERKYDRIMHALGFPIRFAYCIDALPFETTKVSPVVHYIPGHVAQGRRLMLHDTQELAQQRVARSHAETLHYLLRITTAAKECLWQSFSHQTA